MCYVVKLLLLCRTLGISVKASLSILFFDHVGQKKSFAITVKARIETLGKKQWWVCIWVVHMDSWTSYCKETNCSLFSIKLKWLFLLQYLLGISFSGKEGQWFCSIGAYALTLVDVQNKSVMKHCHPLYNVLNTFKYFFGPNIICGGELL